jgi:cytochrome c oxidase subunit 2
MATVAGWIALIGTVAVALVAIFVARQARRTIPDGHATVYGVRKRYAGALIVVVIGCLTYFLPKTPYAALRASDPAMRVNAVGHMWWWELREAGAAADAATKMVLPAGKTVEFAVSSADVTHGFGLYDDSGRLLAQTQAMPGYVNHLRYVFEAPGRYHVLCIEYCGLAHHTMLAELTVQ